MLRRLTFFTLLASVTACADAIDRITPNPPARMVARTQINKSHCIGEAATAICSRIEIVWPQNNDPWLNNWLTGISKNELHTPDSPTLDAAATAFIRGQAQQQGVQGSIADLKLHWTMLGEVGRYRNLLLVRDAQENGTAGRAVSRRFYVLDLTRHVPLALPDIILPGQEQALQVLQRQALQGWLERNRDMSPDVAAQQLASLAQRPAGDWAISRGGLVFSYAAYDMGPAEWGLPLIYLPLDVLRGIIRPEVLTAAGNWTVDVPRAVAQ